MSDAVASFFDHSRLAVEVRRLAERFDFLLEGVLRISGSTDTVSAEMFAAMTKAFAYEPVRHEVMLQLDRPSYHQKIEVLSDWLQMTGPLLLHQALEQAYRDKLERPDRIEAYEEGAGPGYTEGAQGVLIEQFSEASGSVGFMLEGTLALTEAMLMAIEPYRASDKQTSFERIEHLLAAIRPVQAKRLGAALRPFHRYAYRHISAAVLNDYITFCSSSWGIWYATITTGVLVAAYEKAGIEAGLALGRIVQSRSERR